MATLNKLRWLPFVIFLFITGFSFAQKGYRIKGIYDLEVEKNPRREYLEKLTWGSVNSECIPKEGTELGIWFKMKPEESQTTIVVSTGGKNGNLKSPMVYVGHSINYKGDDLLKEVACKSSDENEIRVSLNDLSTGKEYLILITSKEPQFNQFFSIQRLPAYEPENDPRIESKAPEKTRVVMGRLRKVNGEPKVGVLVTLLDESKKSLESVKTDSDGMFNFKKLPPDQTVMTRIEEDDTDLMVDIFLLDKDGNIESRATRIGDRLYGFGANENGFTDLRLLTEKDWAMNVNAGKNGVTGKVVDTKTFLFGQANLEIGLYNLAKKKLATTNTDRNGRFEFRDVDKGDYTVRVEGDRTGKYSEMVVVDELNVPFLFANSSNVGSDGFFEFKKLPAEVVEMKRMEVRDSQMQVPSDFTKMEEGKTIVLKNILFSSGSANLLESSYAELDKLASELKKQTTIRIEISGHTDNTGNSKTNQTLSENRAKAVKDYLVSKGIDASRMSHKGFGDTKPIASNDTEEGKRQNRRVEFVVIK